MTNEVLSLSLLILSIMWCGIVICQKVTTFNVPHSVILSSCSRVILFITTTVILLRHRTSGVTTSYLLSIFWLCFSLISLILHRSAILNYFVLDLKPTSETVFVLSMIVYPFIYVQLILSVFADEKSLNSLQPSKVIDDVSIFSFLSFAWFNKYIYLSTQKFLSVCDLGLISIRLTTKYCYNAFTNHWNFYHYPELLKSHNLMWALVKSFWPWVTISLICDFLFIITLLLPPLLLDRILDFAEHDDYPWRGYFYALIIFSVDFVGKIIQNNAIYLFMSCGVQMKSALMNSIFRKNLLLSTVSRKGLTSGNIANLLSTDAERVYQFTWNLSMCIVCPIKIILIVGIMYQYIGPSSLSGVVVIILLFPVSIGLARVGARLNEKYMKLKDTRLKHMTEVLSGIKILKLYAWEISFSRKIDKARREELKLILYDQICFAIEQFVFFCAPVMVSTASFATFLLADRNNVLDPTRAFVTLTLMSQLRYAMFELPEAINEIVQCNVGIGRLKKFLTLENKDLTTVGNFPDEGKVVSIRQATFTWDLDISPVLVDINLHIPMGKLVAVIGPVGCGKSSLLSSILGELYKMYGSVDLKGNIAYVPQEAWILNKTLKENILLMKSMKEDKYNKILDLCCLRPDLDILPSGDETEIGEKGVNLSGGQKQRVSLARAIYQNRDIYLLDDTLSAVDVHVRKALFDDVIGNEGLLKKKTRILVTHDVSMLHKVDLIVSMKDGQIEEIGTYQSLMENNGPFTSFIQEHSTNKLNEEEPKAIKRFLSHQSSSDSRTFDGDFDKELHTKDMNIVQAYRLTDDETMEVGNVKIQIYWKYIRKTGILMATFILLGYLFYTVFDTAANIWISKWSSDPHINGIQNTSSTIYRLEIYGALGLSQAISILIGTCALMYGAFLASGRYHNKMLDCILKSPMAFFESTPMGRIMNRFSADMDVLDVQMAGCFDGWINCLFFSLASFYIIGSSTPIFLVTLVPLGIIYYILQKLHLTAIWQIKRLESTTKSPIYSQLLECIQGVSSICAFKLQDEFTESFEDKLESHLICFNSNTACDRWLNFYLDILGSSIVLIATLLAIYNRHSLSTAEIGLMITYTLSVTDAMKWFVRMNTELENRSISVERVDEYCELKSEASWKLTQENVPDNWPSEGNILFQNYSTRYRDDLDLVLREINLSINGGEKVGIVGRTGAGKSSITMALFRVIEPVLGTIFIDDIDVTQIGLHTLRSKLTIIPQDPVLFTGTLRSNLDPNDEYSEEELWKSLERSHLKEFVSNLVEGLNYTVEENGANLSSGQKQLVCLARALLKKTKILILDEATASVDMETDNLIQNTIRTAFADYTVITIAHRINTVLDYDKIIVMENGMILEIGSPLQLQQNKESRFYDLCKESALI
nr:multidrug resistance-associated protein 1 isoform X1 [Parasteatoda tepidariorum]